MNSILESITKAELMGARFAEAAHAGNGIMTDGADDAHHPGEDIGDLVLGAFRSHGFIEAKSVVKGYRDGYNTRATALWVAPNNRVETTSAIFWTYRGVTEWEKAAIFPILAAT